MDIEFWASEKSGINIFLRMIGITTFFKTIFIDKKEIDIDEKANALCVDSPLDSSKNLRITVLVDKENVI